LPATLDDLYSLLREIRNILSNEFDPAKVEPQIETITVTTTPAALYLAPKPVRWAIIQNLSSTDTITLGKGKAGKGTVSAGSGIVLNPAPASGQAGGSVVLHNIDLADFIAITNINANQTVSVVYYF
jgi:hypothetical protein